ncbi:polyhomeotic-like protein 3 isoform X4 [Hippoglossus hippoglossus]|uniref:polyhomeotic-like protein 3 isoform X4 n=1 Tax=Hippoglossus hippoglossus TaxID=8267 RepID=UPI00148D543F|nr:polyhomeotic-like protein 3 isoform X4 [Hippoglossus hippoglossus]
MWKVLPHCERCCAQAGFFLLLQSPVCAPSDFFKSPFYIDASVSPPDWDNVPGYGQLLMARVLHYQAGTADKSFPITESVCVTWRMERQRPGEKQADSNRTVAAATTPTTSAPVTMATVSSSCTTCTQAPSASLSIIPSDRQAVQVIQHAIHRPQSMAAQYLHQMYAAQQQHLMLQTAALQQHQHSPQLQSLATIQQASVCQRRPPTPSTGSLGQPAGVSQSSITLPASPVTAQLIGRTHTSNSTTAATTLSQQAMLLGNRPANCNQAQMYLRTQMLILTPAAPVAAVQSDLPAVTSCSSLPTSSQVQNLALRAHLPGALATAHSVILKPSTQPQALCPSSSLSKTSICALKTNQLIDTSTETSQSGPHIMSRAFSPVQTHALVKQQLSCPSGQRVAHHQLILQQTTAGALNHRHLQPIALRVAPQEANSHHLPLPLKRLTTPSTQSHTNCDPHTPSSSTLSSSSSSITSVFASSAQNSIPAATVQPQPPPLVAAPQRRTLFPQVQNQPPPPPPPLVLPRLPQNPPASLQRLSLHSVRALSVQSGHMLLTEQELPVAEALLQMPYQNLPPPQTVAVDLKVHVVRRNDNPPSGQTCKVNRLNPEEKKDGCSSSRQRDRTPTSLIVSPKQNGAVMGSSPVVSSRSVIRSPQVEESSQLTTTSSNGSIPPPPPPSPLPPPILPTTVRGPSQPPSAPASLPGSPDRILTTHILTHLIEGFVIREGLEPFPMQVGPSSLLGDQQASLPESQEIHTNGNTAAEDSPSTDSEMENDEHTDVAELGESVAAVLQCEYCGSRGYAQTFLRSKRFCSMTCVRRFSVSCTKRITVLRAGRWGHRPMGRRGRPPSRVNGASREHFLRQAHGSVAAGETQQCSPREEEEEAPEEEDAQEEEEDQEGEEEEEEEEEDNPPIPMKTRLRKQVERDREREREQRAPEAIRVSDGEEDVGRPSQWNVQQVFSYINSLPGGRVVAEEFRSQEIDGQALLLLTEDHLVSTMNLKLGPALKLCAHINSLKDA